MVNPSRHVPPSPRPTPNAVAPAGDVLPKLHLLRADLAELAYACETRGRLDAADVVMAVSARVAELCEELSAGP